jgi:hypothetical protein
LAHIFFFVLEHETTIEGGPMDRAKVNESEEHSAELEDRLSDATSKETVADLEGNEKSSAARQGQRESDVRSPDGSFDEKRETDDAGPM